MKIKKIIPSIFAVASLCAAVSPVMVSAVTTQRIAPPSDSATQLSYTYSALYDILNSKEYYVSIRDVDTGAMKTVAYLRGNKYISTIDKKGKKNTQFVANGTYYKVNYYDEVITYNLISVPDLDVSVIDYANLKYQTSYDSANGFVEEFSCGSNTELYIFDEKNNLINIEIIDNKGDSKIYEVLAFSDEVPTDLFTMPLGFDIKADSYNLEDTRTMRVFSSILKNGSYTMAFTKGDKSTVIVKDKYDYYCNIIDNKSGLNTKQLAIGADIYTFNDVKKTYEKTDRNYDDQCPVFFNTSKFSLVNVEKVAVDKTEFIVESFKDSYGSYKFYWQGDKLVKIEEVTSKGIVIDTVVFSALSDTVDKNAFTLPTNYLNVSAVKEDNIDISLGDGTAENAEII